jgi:prepilin-type processing-associated H-X9-DG protein
VLAALALAMGRGGDARAQDSLEYAVKAAYLVKIAPFVEWPAGAFSSPTAPLSICVIGADPFGNLLERAARGQKDGDHPIEVRRIAAPDAGCRIAYLGASDDPSYLRAFSGRPVLTVTDGAARPGIVNFVLADGHVRFEIDEDAARASGIAISSKLLSLATRVKGGMP